jgi:hypothetical protein
MAAKLLKVVEALNDFMVELNAPTIIVLCASVGLRSERPQT